MACGNGFWVIASSSLLSNPAWTAISLLKMTGKESQFREVNCPPRAPELVRRMQSTNRPHCVERLPFVVGHPFWSSVSEQALCPLHQMENIETSQRNMPEDKSKSSLPAKAGPPKHCMASALALCHPYSLLPRPCWLSTSCSTQFVLTLGTAVPRSTWMGHKHPCPPQIILLPRPAS